MQLSDAPVKLVLPFADAGAKNTIPVDSQVGITPGAASLTDGFPPLTRTPIAAGGVPPSGLDMNGVLYDATAIGRWSNAGAGYVYDATFAADADVGGYPKGARVLRTDGEGYWLNTSDNNATDPEAGGAGWVPDYTSGAAAITMTSSNVTLTSLQAGRPLIIITGTLTANLNLVFPTYVKPWAVINNTTGAYSITCKTAAGTGVALRQTGKALIFCDGVDIKLACGQFGIAQAWADVSGSRAINTIYQNTTGDTISVTFGCTPTGNIGFYSIDVGVTSPPAVSAISQNFTMGQASSIKTEIPPGHYYKVAKGGVDTTTSMIWKELR